MQFKLGFIGCGNMGGALAKVALGNTRSVAVCDYSEEKIAAMEKLGATPTDIKTLAKESEYIVLGVKPQGLPATLAEIADVLRDRRDAVLVSMAAGVPISTIQTLSGGLPVIRIMPNTPVSVGEGMVLCAAKGVSDEALNGFYAAFRGAGRFAFIPEEEIDAGCALSGCGPAFVYAFAEGLIIGGTECGLSESQAVEYAAQTLKGAAEMLLTYGDPAALKKAVCSPNGATLEGVKSLDSAGFADTVKSAVHAAYKRTLELKK